MNFKSIAANRTYWLLGAGVAAAATADALGVHGLGGIAVFLAIGYLIIRATSRPVSRFIASIQLSIRWKILGAVATVGALFVCVALINFLAMDYMHAELHGILNGDPANATAGTLANEIEDLEATQHGPLFSLAPALAVLGAFIALTLGIGIAISIIEPVRRMSEAMRRIAAGDFSQDVEVSNRDELGELAGRINGTARDLARLREMTLAEERARALRLRIAEVTSAQEDERRRISRELHDGLGPSLAALVNRLHTSRALVATDPLAADLEIERVGSELRGHIKEIRRLINDLRPQTLEQVGLVGAIRQEAERFAIETGINVLSLLSSDVMLDPLAEATVLRIAQESLSNVQRHAQATEVEVQLRTVDGAVELIVRDDGIGFDQHAARTRGAGSGVGLLSMRERAEMAGGTLVVLSGDGRGCRVTLSVPSVAPTKEALRGLDPRPVG